MFKLLRRSSVFLTEIIIIILYIGTAAAYYTIISIGICAGTRADNIIITHNIILYVVVANHVDRNNHKIIEFARNNIVIRIGQSTAMYTAWETCACLLNNIVIVVGIHHDKNILGTHEKRVRFIYNH